MRLWIGLVGYGESGKDTVGAAMMEALPGMVRLPLGDLIKRDCDPVLREYLGISAWTTHGEEKDLIRPFLERYGFYHYRKLSDELFASAQKFPLVVNTRIQDLAQAQDWVRHGGVILYVHRTGNLPKTPQEADTISAVHNSGLVWGTLYNDGTLEQLQIRAREAAHQLHSYALKGELDVSKT